MGKSKQLKTKCNRFLKYRQRDNMVRKDKQSKITDFLRKTDDSAITIKATNRVRDYKINCFQINNQKRLISTENISTHTASLNSFIVLGQEPSCHGYNVTGLNTRHTIVQGNVEKPRTYIYCHKMLNAWPIQNLCTKDTAACLILLYLWRG